MSIILIQYKDELIAMDKLTIALTELLTAFQGGDDGYGALADLAGADVARAMVNAVALLGETVSIIFPV